MQVFQHWPQQCVSIPVAELRYSFFRYFFRRYEFSNNRQRRGTLKQDNVQTQDRLKEDFSRPTEPRRNTRRKVFLGAPPPNATFHAYLKSKIAEEL